jgi:dihydrofolate reductase
MAKIINGERKYVPSRTITSSDWANTTVLTGDVATEVAELKRQDLGELLVIGSLDLAQTLIAHDLVDEFRVTIFPVVLGTGKKLFADGTVPARMELVSSQTTDAGVVACVYRRAGSPTYGSFDI